MKCDICAKKAVAMTPTRFLCEVCAETYTGKTVPWPRVP